MKCSKCSLYKPMGTILTDLSGHKAAIESLYKDNA